MCIQVRARMKNSHAVWSVLAYRQLYRKKYVPKDIELSFAWTKWYLLPSDMLECQKLLSELGYVKRFV